MDVLLQTLLGGALALMGAFVGPFLQRKHDRWLATREDEQLIRNQAQELFDELDRIVRESGQAFNCAFAMLEDQSLEVVEVPHLNRARAISAIYFPACLPVIEDFEQKETELLGKIAEMAINASDVGGDALNKLKGLPVFLANERHKLSSSFVDRMRLNITQRLPKLEVEARNSK